MHTFPSAENLSPLATASGIITLQILVMDSVFKVYITCCQSVPQLHEFRGNLKVERIPASHKLTLQWGVTAIADTTESEYVSSVYTDYLQIQRVIQIEMYSCHYMLIKVYQP